MVVQLCRQYKLIQPVLVERRVRMKIIREAQVAIVAPMGVNVCKGGASCEINVGCGGGAM